MSSSHASGGWRSTALLAALIAFTINVLQPLAHAALLRDGVPQALWTALCESDVAEPQSKSDRTPSTAAKHECCLGLAHASPIADPRQSCIAIVEPHFDVVRYVVSDRSITAPDERRHPSQPRAPPSNS
jgi:hypothetical protein